MLRSRAQGDVRCRRVEATRGPERRRRGRRLLVAVLGFLGKAWYDSRLPETYSVMDYGDARLRRRAEPAGHAAHGRAHGTERRGSPRPEAGTPDARFGLTARSAEIRSPPRRTVEALTFNGTSPGPELRVQQGDLVEVDARQRRTSSRA